MKEYIVYKINALEKKGEYKILPIEEAFKLIAPNDNELPKLMPSNTKLNRPEVQELLASYDCDMLRLNKQFW